MLMKGDSSLLSDSKHLRLLQTLIQGHKSLPILNTLMLTEICLIGHQYFDQYQIFPPNGQ